MPAPTQTTLIDAVNERDERIGSVPRGEALREGRNFRTAHVFVLNARQELLLQRLAGGRERHPGRWGSSVAAYLFAGESYLDGAKRRSWEELGLLGQLEPVGKMEMPDERSLKFVSLFVTHSDTAHNRVPAHISQLEYWPVAEIERALTDAPESFTPTFTALFETFGHRLK